MPEFLEEEDLGQGVRVLKLNRPPASALNAPFLLSIEQRLKELSFMQGLGALILTGTGRVLSAGLDLKEAVDFTLQQQTEICDALNRAYGARYGFPKPVIAAVNGHAIAGGFFFVLASDYRVAAEGSRFGLTEVRVGVRFPVSALEIAGAELSPTMSRRLLLSGSNVSADEALAHNVLDEVLPGAEVMAKIRDAVDNGNDPTLDGWFTEESKPAAAALLAAATRK